MTSSQTHLVLLQPGSSSLGNGSPTKSVFSQSGLGDDVLDPTLKSTNAGAPESRNATGTTTSAAKGKDKQKQISQVVPKRTEDKRIVHEEEPWDAKNVLSFDGGGIRGLYSLLILQQLMNTIQLIEENFSDGRGEIAHATSSFHPLNEPVNVSHISADSRDNEGERPVPSGHFLPCHYFDFICGSSTGGLIAIMLSRLRMTVEDCIWEYENLAGRVFGNPRLFHSTFVPTWWLKRPKYDARNLELAISGEGGVTQRRGEMCPDHDRISFKTGVDTCGVFVFAYKKDGMKKMSFDVPYIFRSYDKFPRGTNGAHVSMYPRNPGRASSFAIWRVARATTAAPLYFEPMQVIVDGEALQSRATIVRRVTSGIGRDTNVGREKAPTMTFIDGGFGEANNPSKEAFYEVTTSNKTIGTFVSIGTGRESPDKFHRTLKRLIKTSFAAVGDPEVAHGFMLNKSEEQGLSYFRLNEPDGLPGVDFDEWRPRGSGRRTRQKIKEAFQGWAINPKVAAELQKCALELVRRRRLRTTDKSQWERYSLVAYFDCKEDNCPEDSTKRWYNRNDFQSHLMDGHKMKEGKDLQKAILSHRGTWKYKPSSNGGLN